VHAQTILQLWFVRGNISFLAFFSHMYPGCVPGGGSRPGGVLGGGKGFVPPGSAEALLHGIGEGGGRGLKALPLALPSAVLEHICLMLKGFGKGGVKGMGG
jgi:hypothetical protein